MGVPAAGFGGIVLGFCFCYNQLFVMIMSEKEKWYLRTDGRLNYRKFLVWIVVIAPILNELGGVEDEGIEMKCGKKWCKVIVFCVVRDS